MTVPTLTRRAALAAPIGGLAFGAAAAIEGRKPARFYRRDAVAFGTIVSVQVEAPSAERAEAAFRAAFAEVRRVDLMTSLTRAESEVFRLNRDGRLDRPDPDLLAMLRVARDMHVATKGAFDVTIQPLWRALDSAAKLGGWPQDGEIRDLLERVDQNRLTFDEDRVAFDGPGMQITLNSLARGLAADRVAAALQTVGVTRALFNIDVWGAAGERPEGGRWRAGVRHPRSEDRCVGIAELSGCLATSGDYQYAWSADFARNHILDARKGASPSDFASVSVLAGAGLIADALSTAAFLVGERDAPALVRSYRAEALFVRKDGGAHATGGFSPA